MRVFWAPSGSKIAKGSDYELTYASPQRHNPLTPVKHV